MAVIIKDMKMPSRCDKCNFCIFEEGWGDYCAANKKILGCFGLNERSKDCPLVEVKND